MEAASIGTAPGRGHELLDAKRLQDEIPGPGPKGGDSALGEGVGGDEDHVPRVACGAQGLHPGEPSPRHADIGDQQVEMTAPQQILRLGHAGGGLHQGELARKTPLHEAAHGGLGIQDQHRGARGARRPLFGGHQGSARGWDPQRTLSHLLASK